MQELKPGKRIVSKGEYAKVQGERAVVVLGGAYLMLTCVALAVIALGSGIGSVLVAPRFAAQAMGLAPPCLSDAVLLCVGVVMTIGCGVGAYITRRVYKNVVKGLDSLNNVVPLTRANAADLPAPDSLVRASQEPMQAQQGVLLRAASGEAQARQEGQLLRASVGGQE